MLGRRWPMGSGRWAQDTGGRGATAAPAREHCGRVPCLRTQGEMLQARICGTTIYMMQTEVRTAGGCEAPRVPRGTAATTTCPHVALTRRARAPRSKTWPSWRTRRARRRASSSTSARRAPRRRRRPRPPRPCCRRPTRTPRAARRRSRRPRLPSRPLSARTPRARSSSRTSPTRCRSPSLATCSRRGGAGPGGAPQHVCNTSAAPRPVSAAAGQEGHGQDGKGRHRRQGGHLRTSHDL